MTLFKNEVKILLVNPLTPHSYWGFQEATWFVGARAAHIPLSLITLAGLFPREWKVRLIDMNIEKLGDSDITWADAVLVTGMILQKESLNSVLRRCRELGVPAIAGGPFASSAPDAEELKDATAIVVGEAEDSSIIDSLLMDLTVGSIRPRYVAASKPDLRLSPTPRYDLLRRGAYCAMALQASRGCPHHCEFCNVRMLFGRRPRYKTPEQVVAELQAIFDTGYRGNIFVVDDNFIGDLHAAREILKAMRDWQDAHGRPFLFYTEADIRLAEQDEIVDLIVAAGFFAIFTGFESPSDAALKEARKSQNVRVDTTTAVSRLRRKGLLVYGGFIVGFDADGPDCFDQTCEFVERCRIDFALVGVLIALPGTPLEERLRGEGRLHKEIVGDTCGVTNIDPKRMSRLDLLRGYRRLVERLYDPKLFFQRAYSALTEWHQHAKRHVTIRELLAVPRSIFRQGIIARYRVQYWRFMLKTLFTQPRKISRAFAMAISGHHFFHYTRRVVLPQLQAAERRL